MCLQLFVNHVLVFASQCSPKKLLFSNESTINTVSNMSVVNMTTVYDMYTLLKPQLDSNITSNTSNMTEHVAISNASNMIENITVNITYMLQNISLVSNISNMTNVTNATSMVERIAVNIQHALQNMSNVSDVLREIVYTNATNITNVSGSAYHPEPYSKHGGVYWFVAFATPFLLLILVMIITSFVSRHRGSLCSALCSAKIKPDVQETINPVNVENLDNVIDASV